MILRAESSWLFALISSVVSKDLLVCSYPKELSSDRRQCGCLIKPKSNLVWLCCVWRLYWIDWVPLGLWFVFDCCTGALQADDDWWHRGDVGRPCHSLWSVVVWLHCNVNRVPWCVDSGRQLGSRSGGEDRAAESPSALQDPTTGLDGHSHVFFYEHQVHR